MPYTPNPKWTVYCTESVSIMHLKPDNSNYEIEFGNEESDEEIIEDEFEGPLKLFGLNRCRITRSS